MRLYIHECAYDDADKKRKWITNELKLHIFKEFGGEYFYNFIVIVINKEIECFLKLTCPEGTFKILEA